MGYLLYETENVLMGVVVVARPHWPAVLDQVHEVVHPQRNPTPARDRQLNLAWSALGTRRCVHARPTQKNYCYLPDQTHLRKIFYEGIKLSIMKILKPTLFACFRTALCVLLLHHKDDEGATSPLSTHLIKNIEEQFGQPLVRHYLWTFHPIFRSLFGALNVNVLVFREFFMNCDSSNNL
ncbi:hypothetical protein TNCV_2569941 [Trichonephila clavipes]|nr:hypothetical protein TNCV_2569941 [Trichonephila clavipes]